VSDEYEKHTVTYSNYESKPFSLEDLNRAMLDLKRRESCNRLANLISFIEKHTPAGIVVFVGPSTPAAPIETLRRWGFEVREHWFIHSALFASRAFLEFDVFQSRESLAGSAFRVPRDFGV
jgi:hypothetical protein